MKFLIKHRFIVLGAILGAIGGYLYYHYIGCASGSCAITSKPINSTVYGALMGALFFNLFQKETIKKELE